MLRSHTFSEIRQRKIIRPIKKKSGHFEADVFFLMM